MSYLIGVLGERLDRPEVGGSCVEGLGWGVGFPLLVLVGLVAGYFRRLPLLRNVLGFPVLDALVVASNYVFLDT